MRQGFLTAAAVLAMATGPALSQDVLVSSQGQNELLADWVVGASILSPDGENIGKIQDLILDSEEGSVTAAVVSVGGFLGLGAKSIAVDWNELDIAYDGNEITLDLTREEAEEASEYNYREREFPPPPEPQVDTGTGTGTGTGMTGTGTTGTTD